MDQLNDKERAKERTPKQIMRLCFSVSVCDMASRGVVYERKDAGLAGRERQMVAGEGEREESDKGEGDMSALNQCRPITPQQTSSVIIDPCNV